MIDLMTLKPGDRLQRQGKVVAEVVRNMEDGQWVEVRYLETPEGPGDADAVELCHAQDIVRVLSTAS
jgi:hypothetical protein